MEIAVLLVLGLFSGAAGSLIGAGGGFIIIPVLIMMYPDMPPAGITSLSLATIFFNSLSASYAYGKMKRIDYRAAFCFVAASVPAALLGAIAIYYIPRDWFAMVFGLLLLGVSAVLLLRPTRRESASKHGQPYTTTHTLVAADGKTYTWSFNMPHGLMIATGAGFFSSMLGLGGGILFVPAMTYVLNFPVHVATATSQFMLIFMAMAGCAVHLARGTIGTASWELIGLVPGVLIGAQLGAYLSTKLSGTIIIRVLAIGLGIVALRLIATVFG